MDAARKAEILARVEAWLDALEDEEPLPAGLDPTLAAQDDTSSPTASPGPPPDLASLAAAVTASAREAAISGKTTKRLAETVASLSEGFEVLRAGVEAIHMPDPEAWARAMDVARSEEQEKGFRDLLELYDRLERCAREARAAVRALPVPARWVGGARAIQAVARGVELTLERLVEILERAGVKPVLSTGESFDARTMRAVDTVPPAGAFGPGMVVETLRAGFSHRGSVLRFAEVRVARAGPESGAHS